MLSQVKSVFGLVLVAALCADQGQAGAKPSKPPAWQTFTSPDKSFSVQVPFRVKQRLFGPSSFLWGSQVPGSIYLFGYVPNAGLTKSTPESRRAVVKKLTDELLKSSKITQTSRQPIPEGVEVFGTLLELPVDARVIGQVKRDCCFVALAIGKTDRKRFFSGFRLTP